MAGPAKAVGLGQTFCSPADQRAAAEGSGCAGLCKAPPMTGPDRPRSSSQWFAIPACLLAGAAFAQTTAPAARELPEAIQRSLDTIEDMSFSYAHPGFFALLGYVKTAPQPPGHAGGAVEVEDWRALLERSADFRGAAVLIEGVVGRQRAWELTRAEQRELGPVWELSLQRPDQPIVCKLLLTENADDVPLGATVRATGYFVMIQQYYSETNRLRQAAVLVAAGPTRVSAAAPPHASGRLPVRWIGALVAAIVGLLIAWLLLRHAAGPHAAGAGPLRASQPPPFSVAEDLAAWAAEREEENAEDLAADGQLSDEQRKSR